MYYVFLFFEMVSFERWTLTGWSWLKPCVDLSEDTLMAEIKKIEKSAWLVLVTVFDVRISPNFLKVTVFLVVFFPKNSKVSIRETSPCLIFVKNSKKTLNRWGHRYNFIWGLVYINLVYGIQKKKSCNGFAVF